MYGQASGWQDILDDITPFDGNDGLWIIQKFPQFSSYDARFLQAIEIEVVEREFACPVFAHDSKGRAGDMILAAHAGSHAADERRLAAAQVTGKQDNFAAAEPATERTRELFGVGGACRIGLICHDGTHMLRIVPRGRLLLQVYRRESANVAAS